MQITPLSIMARDSRASGAPASFVLRTGGDGAADQRGMGIAAASSSWALKPEAPHEGKRCCFLATNVLRTWQATCHVDAKGDAKGEGCDGETRGLMAEERSMSPFILRRPLD